MAIIRQINVITKESGKHGVRPCTASYEPGLYLQLDTYASEEGMEAGSVKQTLRFEREGALRLLELMRKAFPDLLPGSR